MTILISGLSVAYGHTTVEVEPYEIEVGWGIEPPVVGFRNDFVFAKEDRSNSTKSRDIYLQRIDFEKYKIYIFVTSSLQRVFLLFNLK